MITTINSPVYHHLSLVLQARTQLSPKMGSSPIIVGKQYCKGKEMELAFSTTIDGVKNEELAITDLEGKALFWLSSDIAIKKKWFILDAASGLPLLSIIKKSWSVHRCWQVFQGDSTDETNLLFTVRKNSTLNIHKEWDVFLPGNTECDFKITGEYRKRSIRVVDMKDPTSKRHIAEMSQHDEVVKVRLADDAFRVTINPNMDFAFIASLICILHQTQQIKDARRETTEEIAAAITIGVVEGAIQGAMSS